MHLAIFAMFLIFTSFTAGEETGYSKVFTTKASAVSIPDMLHEFTMSCGTCRPGDSLTVSGYVNPQDFLTITLKNPHGKVIGSHSIHSDNTGFYSLDLKIPDDAIFGVWNIDVSEGTASSVKALTIEYLAPLKQLKAGTNAKSTDCNPGLELVIKAEDGSPACVRPQSAQRLMEKGWARESVAPPDLSSYQPVGIVSLQMIPPYGPGGPTIQMTLKNNGIAPITNLKAVLELYSNYTFDFTNVTPSSPIPPGSYASETKTLIGGGFQSDFPYPLVISGVAGDTPFNFTENIHIPYPSENAAEDQTSTIKEFEGVIIDQSLDATHNYSFYTNDTSTEFNIGSNGIWLEGLNNIDGLDGKHVKILGTIVQLPHREDEIKVEKLQMLGSYVPKGGPRGTWIYNITLDDLYNNPDKYYNQTVTISGQLREYDYQLAYAGVGCFSAQYTTNNTFVPDFISRHQLYDGEHYIGVRIGGSEDVGYSASERLPVNLKNQQVTITGIFVPEIHDTGMCMHVLHESGYILTDFSKIHLLNG